MADGNKNKSLWDRIQFCDPRILYALFAVVVIVFEMVQVKMPVPNPVWVGKLYDKVESLPWTRRSLLTAITAPATGASAKASSRLSSNTFSPATLNLWW